ncbi:MAG: hypothetical protein FJX76_03720 [Armatimonadetes bacterium]|nr:hypothetical protein [Armatimonadota bacterium]
MSVEVARGGSRLDLPEIEWVRRHLEEHVVGATIRAVEVVTPRLFPGKPRAEIVDRLLNGTLHGVGRHGRTLVLQVGAERLALPVQGVAYLAFGTGTPPADLRLALEFADRGRLWYGAPAGIIHASLSDSDSKVLSPGVEPLSSAFSLANFKRILSRKKRTTHALLVDDELLAGIGGLYADEILFAARVRPTRVIPALKADDVRHLYYAILEVLQKAARFGGVSSEDFALVEGRSGSFGRFLTVHGQTGAPCQVCRAQIRCTTTSDARTWFCPRCQRE